jgi:transcriptional regulator with XRE-family HTH domain
MNIGKKIKDIRKQKGLTQAELAQNVITRNMLSQIESGKATPSLPTLLHIASVLEVPVEFFISESEDIEAFTRGGFASELKRLYSKKRYEDCLFTFERSNRKADDEIALILASCYLNIGKHHLDVGNVKAAENALNASIIFSDKTVYASKETKRRARIYLAMISNFRKKSTTTDVLEVFEDVEDNQSEFDLLMYLNTLKLIDEQKSEYAAKLFDSMRIKNVLYRMHINAKLSIAALNHQRARELLIQALDGTCGDADPILRYRLLNDLEGVCKALSDYETAYNASIQKNEIYTSLNI